MRAAATRKSTPMTRKTIDYARLGVEAREAFADRPATFADFVRTILSVAAPLHVLQTPTNANPREPLNAFTPLSETKH
jgi:hypothetical protein